MSAARDARPRRSQRPAGRVAPAPLPRMTPGALAFAAFVAAVVIALSVTVRLDDKDFFQHLRVGRMMWETHSLPKTDLWTWPGHGSPYLVPSWFYRVVLWPFWAIGGLWGLYAWRWISALGAFGLLWAAARRMGATGAAPLLMLVWCALFERQRSQVRPDTFVAVMLACEVFILESRRRFGKPSAAWLVPMGWMWVNAHISYPLFFIVAGGYWLDAVWRNRRGGRAMLGARGESPRALVLALLGALVVAPINPWGLEMLRQPFDYYFSWRVEPLYVGIWELRTIEWGWNLRNGLPVFLAVMTLLAVLRARRAGPDLAQWVLVPALFAQAYASQRFIGYFAIVAAPFAARDLASLVADARGAVPAALRAPGARAAAVAAACVALAIPELVRPDWPLGVGLDPVAYPVKACDWVESHGVRGRSFNAYWQGGYLIWRFWPDRGRLPFMDIHQTATRKDRDLYAYAWGDSGAWHELDAERRFEWALVPRKQGAAHLLDFLDADSTWALVFADDAAALYLRRTGPLAALAAREAFVQVPGGTDALPALVRRVTLDRGARAAAIAELRRQVADSPVTGQAHSQLANLEALDGDWKAALADVRAARRIDPRLPLLDERERTALQHLDPRRSESR